MRRILANLYPKIAATHNTTVTRVERSIRHAIGVCMDRGDDKAIYKIFGQSIKSSKGKPTNKEFILALTEHVRKMA